jgi:gliding motility-associated-like protein
LPLQITNIASTNPTCVPGNDGSLTVSATGGTTNYQYSLNGGIQQASNTFSNLGSGVYTIQVTDANGCTTTSTQNISAPNAPLITSVQVLDAGCDPGNDGSITITASGGTPGYTYSSNGVVFQGSSLLSGLSAGSYTVVVQDAIGCQGSSVVNIGTQPSPSVAVGTITDATCIPGCDGTAQFSASGGTSPTYTYSINNGLSFQANSLFNGICAGNYTVTVKDGNGCTGTTLFAISTVNGPSFTSASSTDVLCNGTNTGTISSTLSGGTMPINYNLQPINLNNGTGQFTLLNANTYTLNASDANGCTATTVVTVAEPPLLQFANVNMNGSLCNGNSNGSIDVSTTGGTPSITYTITPSATFSPPSSFINLLGNTTYTIQATDANGCSITTSITVTQPQALSFTQAQATDVICNGQSNGQISTSAIGGTGLLTYDLMPGSVNNTIGVFTGLNAGAYTVTVTDINNCTLTTTLQIAEPPAIVIDTILVQNETCNNALNGSISVSASGGFGMLIYTLLPINVSNPIGTFSGLAGNTYTVVISDANACTYTTQVIVINPATVQWDSTNSSGVLCNGGNTGSIQVAASGGTGLITYTLQPNSITNTTGLFANLSAGQFTITAMDVNNCTTSTIIVVSEPLPLQGNLVSKTDVTCHNTNDGTLTVSANGGVTPYSYTLQPTLVNNTTGVFANLAGGIYSVTITDSNLCTTVVNNITIINPTQVAFTQVLHEDIKCYGDPSGSITVQAAGGVGTITFTLQPNLGTQLTSGVFDGLPAGVYTVTALDGNNCSTNTVITIIQNPQIVITSVEYREPTCWGDADGSMNITAAGGVGALSYQLNIGNPQSNGYYTNLLAGGYLITIRDTLGCTMDTTLVLTQPEPVHFSSLDPQPVYCVGASNGKIIVKGSGGRGGYKYYLRPGLFINTSGVFSGLHEGLYTLTIKDSAGCHFDTVISIQPPLNPFSITTTQKNLGCYGTGIEGWAEVITQGGDAPYTYLWSTSPVQNTPRAENLTFGYYFVEVTDGNGCIDKDTVYIEPGPCCEEVFIPNAFSPNGDGNNDIFRITTSAGIELIQLEVFNRWGNKVWSTNDFRSGWDGKYLGQDETLNTYYYVFRYKCLTDGQNYIKKGDLILMR